jgi:hypothetical protein
MELRRPTVQVGQTRVCDRHLDACSRGCPPGFGGALRSVGGGAQILIRDAALSIGAFLFGVVVVVWSTERPLEGMVGLAALLRLAPFAIAGIFSGLEAENVAVGLIAAHAMPAAYHVTLKGCCHRVGCSSDPAHGASSDWLINNSLLWNSRATS